MASVWRPTVIVYKDSQGRRCTKDTPGAKPTKVKTRRYWGKYRDAAGEMVRRALDTKDRQTAKQIVAKLEDNCTQAKFGLIPASMAISKPTTLAEHLTAYRAVLEARSRNPEHIKKTIAKIQAVLDGCQFVLINQLQPSAVEMFLADLRQPRPFSLADKEAFTVRETATVLNVKQASIHRLIKRGKLLSQGANRNKKIGRESLFKYLSRRHAGISPETSNHYLVAIKGFVKWLVADGRAYHNPLAKLAKLNVEVDVRKVRRILDPIEFARLLEAARGGKSFRGLTGADRVMLYTLAAYTGMRANELATLTPNAFTKDGDGLSVTILAAYSKHREKDTLPVHPVVGSQMLGYLEGKPVDQPIWPRSWSVVAAEMVRLDLDAAGIPYEVNGEEFDFHALRAQFITEVLRVAETESHARLLSRHKSQKMLDRYNKMKTKESRNLMNRLAPVQSMQTA